MTLPTAYATRVCLQSRSTGKERDSESGNDYFGARYYASTMGRFMSPDPVQLKANRLTNPQRLNLYNYAVDNPLTNVDPDGKDSIAIAYQDSHYAGFGAILGNKAWSLGHAGIVNISSKGVATYYDKNGTGVHKENLGTFTMDPKTGKLSSSDTGKILQHLSTEHGEGGAIWSTYVMSADKQVSDMNSEGDRRAAATPSEPYAGTNSNCANFVEDDLRAGDLPSSASAFPNNMLNDVNSGDPFLVTPLPDLKNNSDKAEQQFVKDRDNQLQRKP